MKKIIFVALAVYLLLPLMAQKSTRKVPKPPFKINRQQMYEDFDQFVHIIKIYNAQWEIRKEHTGYDILAALEERRQKIVDIKNYWDFIDFMDVSLDYVLDVHARRRQIFYNVPSPRYAPGQSFYDSAGIEAISTGVNLYLQNRNQITVKTYKNFRQCISNCYINGHYYITDYNLFKNAHTGDSIYFHNARVIACDHQPIDLYVKKLIGKNPPYWIRWDFHKQKYYTSKLCVSYNKTLKIEDETGNIYEFIPNQFGIQIGSSEDFKGNVELMSQQQEQSLPWKERAPQGISYLPEQKILYIYTRMMRRQEDYNLIDSIKKEGRAKSIEKVVIDVRGNQGGGDGFWMSMLSSIIKDTLYFEDKVALNCNDEVKAYFSAEFPPEMTQEFVIKEIPLLGNKKMLVHEGKSSIDPDSNSLNFEGQIYIFQDQETYSSGHSFTSIARQIPQLVSMGMPTGNMAGFGFNPWGFQLKNSRYTFCFEPAIDLSKAEKWEDIFQDIPEIEVIPTLQEHNDYTKYIGIAELNEFLLSYDYLFKKVLEIE
jgi:hypothetical protein